MEGHWRASAGSGGTAQSPSAAYGANLLRDINGPSLFEILREVEVQVARVARSDRHRPSVHIRQIDALLRVLAGQPAVRPAVIELTSLRSAAGKTNLLYYIAARAVLPASTTATATAGDHGGGAVVYVDADGRFDARRLRAVARGILADELARKQEDAAAAAAAELHLADNLVEQCLQHVHVLQPSSSAELLAMLADLPSYLLAWPQASGVGFPAHQSHARRIHSLLIDSASAFFYEDAHEVEVSRLTAGTRSERYDAFAQSRMLLDAVRRFQAQFQCLVVYTSWSLPPRVRRAAAPSFTSAGQNASEPTAAALPAAWASFPTCRYVLRRERVAQLPCAIPESFAQATTPQGADTRAFRKDMEACRFEELAMRRQASVQRGMFVASLDTAVLPRASISIAAASEVSFAFSIDTGGVHVQERTGSDSDNNQGPAF
ncbi:hypothetical protein KEM52_000228 [Ascosphaera acerosa]|nr:hypothetical protein KEM52_000228 [Ascosphaera acerosa]